MKPARADRRFSLAETAERIGVGLAERDESTAWVAVRDFVDGYRSAPHAARFGLIEARPRPIDPRFDAYLAALAEHLAVHDRLCVPAWSAESTRFLDQWWFPTRFRALHAMALVQSPASFRRRGVFVDATEFQRV